MQPKTLITLYFEIVKYHNITTSMYLYLSKALSHFLLYGNVIFHWSWSLKEKKNGKAHV